MELLFLLGVAGALIALVFAYFKGRKVLKLSEGNKKMVEIAKAIREGANAYLKRQYKTVIIFFAAVFVILLALAFIPVFVAGRTLYDAEAGRYVFDWLNAGLVNPFSPFAFITGGFFTGLSGFIGMKVATASNARTAHAAETSLNKGLNVSFSSGTVMGFTVAGLGLLDITLWFIILRFAFGIDNPVIIGESMVKFGIGVCAMAMFSRVGGGIFTKAADVGADLVGKVEKGIPEDDPRNPAVIADNVGDNVGDVAGMGADLYEAYAHAIIATFALGVGIYSWAGMLLPILIAAVGIVASIVGTFFVRTKENASQKALLHSLHRGTFVAAGVAAALSLPIVILVARIPEMRELFPAGREWGIFGAIVIGIVAGLLIGYFTERFTSDNYKPTKDVAKSSRFGSATVIIGGTALGMKATVGPILTIAVATIASFLVSGGLGGEGASIFTAPGLYGIGIAAVGMLSTLGINLAADAFGPVADNAGGIAEMAHLPAEVRQRTDALDALGNTTAATGKGFSIGSTAFTALALLVSYVALAGGEALNLTVTNPPVLIGVFVGGVTAFFFAALCISAVGKAAESIVDEVRRQFRDIPGLMEGTGKPEYGTCVDLCTKSALRKMIAPSLLSFLAPIVTGFILGAEGVVGFLAGVVVTGFALAIFMMTSGGAWDNAKKHIEKGNFNGKGSDNHKAAVIGDTVGDPFKDTAGPSFNILITLASTVAIVFVQLAEFNLIGLLM